MQGRFNHSRASDNYSAPCGEATNITVNSEKVKTKGKYQLPRQLVEQEKRDQI